MSCHKEMIPVVLKIMNNALLTFIILVFGLPLHAVASGKFLTLEQFVNEVEVQSPDLVIEKANIEVAKARASGVRISPPMVGAMQMKDSSGTNRGYEISQEIPFPTKLSNDKKLRNLEFDTQQERSRLQKISLLADARVAYTEFWSASTRFAIQKEKLEWLRRHLKITKTTSWSDTSAKVHLLEVESEADLLENEVLTLEAEVAATKATLRNFVPELNVEEIIPVEPTIPSLEIETKTLGPAVVLKEKELAAMNALEDYKKQTYLPDFLIRLRSFNGNEISPQSQELMVGISLPFVFFWQPKAEVAEASAQKLKAEAELQKSKIEFESKLSSLTKKLESNQMQLINLREKLIPRAERRMKLVQNLSTRTMEGLDQHKIVMTGFLDLKIRSIDLRADYEKTIREILKLANSHLSAGVGK